MTTKHFFFSVGSGMLFLQRDLALTERQGDLGRPLLLHSFRQRQSAVVAHPITRFPQKDIDTELTHLDVSRAVTNDQRSSIGADGDTGNRVGAGGGSPDGSTVRVPKPRRAIAGAANDHLTIKSKSQTAYVCIMRLEYANRIAIPIP